MAHASQPFNDDPSEQPETEASHQPNEALKRAREARGWTQNDVALRVGCSLDAVQRWERGDRQPQPTWRAKLCKVFESTPEELHLLSKRRIKQVLSAQHEVSVIEVPVTPSITSNEEATSQALVVSAIEWERPSRFRQVVDKRRRLLLVNSWEHCIRGLFQELLEYPMLLSVDLEELSVSDTQTLLNPQQLTHHTHDLPTGTDLVQVYDEADGELLILGKSGSGKSVQLLELTRQLFLRAEEHETAPLPVFFLLNPWPEGLTSLDEWLVTRLHENYGLPEKIGRIWLETDQLVLLLDGFDEVSEEARPACVKALQTYQDAHPLSSVVICCLTEVAPTLTRDVHFRQTVYLKSLSEAQMDLYLTQTGCQRKAVQQAFQDDPELQAMCTNLLMLKSVASIYQDEEHATLALSGSIEMRRRQIFEHCIHSRLARYQEHAPYSAEQTMHWLSWMAWHMQKHRCPDLYLERMQPSWLANDRQSHRYQRMVSLLIVAIHCVIAGGLVAWLKGGLKKGVMGSGNGILGLFGGGAGNSMLGWMAPGIGGGCEGGASLIIILALMVWLIAILVGSSSLPVMTPRAFWRGIKSGVQAGGILGVVGTLLTLPLFTLRGGWHYGVFYGLGTGFLLGIIMGLMRGLGDGLRYGQKPSGERALGTFVDHARDGLVWGLCGALGFAAVEEILRVNQTSTLLYSMVLFLFFFLAYGFGGGDRLFASLLVVRIEPTEMVVWSWRHLFQDIRENSLRSLSVALVVSGATSLAIAAVSSFFYGLSYGIHYGLVLGIISGLIVSLASFFATMLKSGWSADILPKEQRNRPNEGILRSGKNALLGACLFAPLGGIASGLACCLGFGVIGQLPTWPTMGMAFAVMMTIIIFATFVTAHGGIAWVEHYLLRAWLSRTGCIPKNYVAFLNTASAYKLLLKVRGSYSFSHRLYREHFAGVYQRSLQPEQEEHSPENIA